MSAAKRCDAGLFRVQSHRLGLRGDKPISVCVGVPGVRVDRCVLLSDSIPTPHLLELVCLNSVKYSAMLMLWGRGGDAVDLVLGETEVEVLWCLPA